MGMLSTVGYQVEEPFRGDSKLTAGMRYWYSLEVDGDEESG
jgi:hypothetical protein